MFIPNGRLSAVQFEDEKVQIQTEFAVHPRPRVTTCVVLAGQVVLKEEQLWEAETESPEGQKELESCLQRQHFAVHTRVEQQEIDLSGVLPQASKAKVTMPGVVKPGEGARHPASRVPGVLRLFIVSKSGDFIAADDSGIPGSGSAGLFTAAAELIEFWETAESQRFAQMITRGRESNYLLVRHFGKYWGAELSPGADPDETLEQFLPALET